MNEKSLVGAQQNVQMAEEEAKLGDEGEKEEHEQMSGPFSQAAKPITHNSKALPKPNQ